MNISRDMDKFRDKDGHWRAKNKQLVEEDIPKFADSYTLHEDETERGYVKLERERNGSKGLWREAE